MRIALLTDSILPRGGVVHVLELGTALLARGHDVTIIAPGSTAQGLFRPIPCRLSMAPCEAAGPDLATTLRRRSHAMREHLRERIAAEGGFDVYHAHDGVGAHALAELAAEGLVGAFVRTVHHVDRYNDPEVEDWEERAILAATRVLAVSAHWCRKLRVDYGVDAQQVSNGIDLKRFNPQPEPGDAAVLRRIGIDGGPLILAVGGVERRKNTRRLLEAFVQLQRRLPRAQLVVAGGASLMQQSDELEAFLAEAQVAGLSIRSSAYVPRGGMRPQVIRTGPLPDAELPALYRAADVVAMPSLLEGFGLAALEGLACGARAVVSSIPPFTEHFADDDVCWADPRDAFSIAQALLEAVAHGRVRAAPAVCRRYGWDESAVRHEAIYRGLPAVVAPRRAPAAAAAAPVRVRSEALEGAGRQPAMPPAPAPAPRRVAATLG